MKSFLALLFSLFSLALYAQHAYLLPEQQYYDVSYYDIALTVDVDAEFIDGRTTISGEIVQNDVDQILLNFYDNMTVDSVKYQGQLLGYTHSNNILTVDLPQSLNTGDGFYLEVYYNGNPITVGPFSSGLNFTEYNSLKLVYSYNWPYFANTFIPCKDHPSDKADSLRLAVTVPDVYEVAANGVLAETNVLPGNRVQFVWESHYPLTPYHISINIYPFDVIQSSYNSPLSGPIDLEYFLFPNNTPTAQPQLETVVPQIHEAFEATHGVFPFPNEKYGICESVISGGMEHQTILTMNYPSFFSDIVVHESAHEYFGNMISIADWGHIWLSEGFATYSEAIFQEYWNGPAAYQSEISQNMASSGSGTIFVSDPSNPANIIPYNLVYLKASVVLHMLRYVMGDGLFFQMLHDYVTISPFRFKNIDTEQFRVFCEGYYGSELSWFFDQWIYGDGKMAAQYFHYWDAGADSLVLKVRSVPASGATTYHEMPLPLLLTTNSNQMSDTLWIDSASITKKYAFNDTSGLQVEFDPGNMILKGPFEYIDRPVMEDAGLLNDSIHVTWQPFFDYTEYEVHIYREVAPGIITQIGVEPVSGYEYTAQPSQAGTYLFAVAGVQFGHPTGLSELVSVNYTTFPMDQGILIVDETRNGDGSNMFAPTDSAVDAFYETLLAGYAHDDFDVISEGRVPTVLDFASYEIILWHHDVILPSVIAETTAELTAYLNAGGRLIISGMNFLAGVDADFAADYLGYLAHTPIGSADFTGAAAQAAYPALPVDSTKITIPSLNHKLRSVAVFDTTGHAGTMYRYLSGSGNPLYHLKTCGVLAPSVPDTTQTAAITLGFPLWFIQADSARSFIRQAMQDWGVPVSIKSTPSPAPTGFTLKQNYPNPFNGVTTIEFSLPSAEKVTLKIYNILGEEVATLVSQRLPAGQHRYQWNAGRFASGVYFYRIEGGEFKDTKKLLLLK